MAKCKEPNSAHPLPAERGGGRCCLEEPGGGAGGTLAAMPSPTLPNSQPWLPRGSTR